MNGLGVLCRNAFLKSDGSVKSSSASSLTSGSPVGIAAASSSSGGGSSPFFAFFPFPAPFLDLAAFAASSALRFASSFAATAALASASFSSN